MWDNLEGFFGIYKTKRKKSKKKKFFLQPVYVFQTLPSIPVTFPETLCSWNLIYLEVSKFFPFSIQNHLQLSYFSYMHATVTISVCWYSLWRYLYTTTGWYKNIRCTDKSALIKINKKVQNRKKNYFYF